VLQADVTPESSPETIESWDSVQHLNLVLALEEEYGFEFLPEEMDQAKTVGRARTRGFRQARRLMPVEILPYRAEAVPPSASSTTDCWPAAGCWLAAP